MLYMGAYIFSYGMNIFLKYDERNAASFILFLSLHYGMNFHYYI